MKLDNSNRRYSDIVAWILVFALLSIFMGTLIGCWGNCIYEEEGALLAFPLNREDKIVSFYCGKYNDEPAAQTSEVLEVDTVRGSMTYEEAGFYNSTDDLIVDLITKSGQFPLCILESEGYYFNITVNVTGGYSPADVGWCDYIQLKQYKAGTWDLLHSYKIYYDDVNWTLITEGVCSDLWRLHVVVDKNMCFESNNKWDCSGTLGKWVSVKLKSSWEGCPLETQEFCCSKTWYCLDTEKGDIELLNMGIFDGSFEFELCYDFEENEILGYIYAHVTGGYEPFNQDTLSIWQEKPDGTYISGLYELSNIEWKEYDQLIHGVIPELAELIDGCCETVYIGEVSFGETILENGQDSVMMKFDANHPPPCCTDKELDKPVLVELESIWTGCGQLSQTFTYMLVHKNNIFRSPQLPISSPVECNNI
jgi:hypothetical protein